MEEKKEEKKPRPDAYSFREVAVQTQKVVVDNKTNETIGTADDLLLNIANDVAAIKRALLG